MVGDYDHDGRVDIAVAAELASQLTVFEYSTAFER